MDQASAEGLMPDLPHWHRMKKKQFKELVPGLRVDLVNAQYELKRRKDFSVVIAVAGDDWLGVNGVLNRLNEWMDARLMPTYVFRTPSDEEAARPYMWRLWRHLPGRGGMVMYAGAAVQETIAARTRGDIDDEEFKRRIDNVNNFEQELADDNTLLLRFWITAPRAVLQQRLASLGRKNMRTWQIRPDDWRVFDATAEAIPVARKYLQSVASYTSPWHVVDGTQARFRDYTVGRTIADAIWDQVQDLDAGRVVRRAPAPTPEPIPAALEKVDLSATVDYDRYGTHLENSQRRLRKITNKAFRKGVSTVVVMEGWDAAGKGGAIRRMTMAMEAGDYRVVQIAAPTPEEISHHYMWRFWWQLPEAGHMVVFDRSWYGRVLVERVEGFAREDEWRRAYDEINDFEEQIVDHGIPVVKFWLHIDPDEQLRRFKDREQTAYKKYKITEEDYRNREKWQPYVDAVDEMVARTDTKVAPWHLVSANDKRHARLQVIDTVCDAIEGAL